MIREAFKESQIVWHGCSIVDGKSDEPSSENCLLLKNERVVVVSLTIIKWKD